MSQSTDIAVGDGSETASIARPHPRRISWIGASSLALGGSNQSIFLIGALLAAQGSAAIPLLIAGLALSYMATPGWIELSCMFPNRVGGIAATCAEAFRPYSNVLSNLTGVCYWWGWVPTCGLTAIFSANAIHEWYLPSVPVKLLATVLVLVFMGINLCGLRWAVRIAVPVAIAAAFLALCTSLLPIFAGHVDWRQASSFHLTTPFGGSFGKLTSAMAGLYLIGFAAPAFEAAACHIGEMRNPAKDQPRAMWISGGMASIYFVLMPVVWLGMFGSTALQGDLATVLGPSFAPLFGSLAKAAAIWFITLNMFSGTIQPLSGASRTLSQLSEDGLLPVSVGYRSKKTDAPVVAILVTATASIVFLLAGDPTSLVAAANLTYLIGIALPSVAVALLRRHEPGRPRPYRARTVSIWLGVAAAGVWLVSTILGFEQFGLPVVIFGLLLAYSGAIAYSWRLRSDRRKTNTKGPRRSLHLKLTGAMLLVLFLDGAGYLVAVSHVSNTDPALVALLKDIFVTVGLLTISFGLVLPGMISHTAEQVTVAAKRLAEGTLRELTRAMGSLASGDLEAAHATVTNQPVSVRTEDEFKAMAVSFNLMQDEAGQVAISLDTAAEELRQHRDELERLVDERTQALSIAFSDLSAAETRRRDLLAKIRKLSAGIGATSGEPSDLPSAIEGAAESLGVVLGADVVAVHLAQEDHLGAVVGSWCDSRVEVADRQSGVPLVLGPPLLRYLQDHEILTIADLQANLDLFDDAAERDLLAELPIGAFLACPITSARGGLIGVVALAKVRASYDWSEDDVVLVETVSADLGRVIANAMVFEEQQALLEEHRELDQMKTNMLSTFSHELRTPLTSIQAYVEMLHDDEDTALLGGRDHVLGVIERNAKRLTTLIEDILTLSHVTSDVFGTPLSPVELDPLVDAAAATLRPRSLEQQVTLEVDHGSPGAMVLGDSDQLERVVLNLLSNAIKFTPAEGRVTVSTFVRDGAVILQVTDNGIGISPDELDRVSEQFFRGSNAQEAVIMGTGLGMAIVKAIVDHHQGTLEITSSLGHGTTVTVTLPGHDAVAE